MRTPEYLAQQVMDSLAWSHVQADLALRQGTIDAWECATRKQQALRTAEASIATLLRDGVKDAVCCPYCGRTPPHPT